MRLALPLRLIAALLAAAIPSLALAHAGHDHAAGFVQGLAHPLAGMDHVLAMVAAGLLAGRIGGAALWQVPASFIAMMAVGASLGLAGIRPPLVEAGIAVSIIAFGMLLAGSRTVSVGLSACVGGLALFHGYAHGAEALVTVSGVAYICGLMSASALLHLAGACIARMLVRTSRAQGTKLLQLSGGVLTAAGIMTLAGVF